MKSNKQKPSRRDFLKLMGQGAALPLMQTPLQILIQSILAGAVQSAAAEAAGVRPRKLLHILFAGAPSRWMHDHFLTPYEKNYMPSLQVGTSFTNDGSKVTGLGYSTILRKGINVPHMWQFQVPDSSGGMRPMDDLLNNMLHIRGINIGNPDHAASQALQFLPLGADQSLSALSADKSSAPIPAINAGVNSYRFRSTAAKSACTVSNYGNMLKNLLEPFNRKTYTGFANQRLQMDSVMDNCLKALNASAQALHPDADVIAGSMNAARDLLSKGFANLDADWNALLLKYKNLMSAAINPSRVLVGINDFPIPSNGTSKYQANGIVINNGLDIRKIITTNSRPVRMAEHFAMAEYILINNLSDSITIGPGRMEELLINSILEVVDFDEHGTSGMVALLINTNYNMAFSACLLELIDRLKEAGIFSETVIVSGGEFSRSTKTDGSGSDHGYLGGSSSIYSGALTGPMVLGNILIDDPSDHRYRGTWGQSAPVSELGKTIDLGHWSSTIAQLLRVPSPITASKSLLMEKDSSFVPIIEKARQV